MLFFEYRKGEDDHLARIFARVYHAMRNVFLCDDGASRSESTFSHPRFGAIHPCIHGMVCSFEKCAEVHKVE